MTHDFSRFCKACAEWGVEPDAVQLSRLGDYYDLLVEENAHTNLTAITSFEEVSTLHFLDSLGILQADKTLAEGRRLHLIDIGTGAGFPGVVLKIFFPEWEVTLLDARQKRVLFLETLLQTLGLATEGCRAVCGRAEDVARKESFREQYDIACARALSAFAVAAEYALPFVKPGGWFAAYRSQEKGAAEQAEEKALQMLGARKGAVVDFTLPLTDVKRRIIRADKIGPTDARYPRRAGVPQKKPLPGSG